MASGSNRGTLFYREGRNGQPYVWLRRIYEWRWRGGKNHPDILTTGGANIGFRHASLAASRGCRDGSGNCGVNVRGQESFGVYQGDIKKTARHTIRLLQPGLVGPFLANRLRGIYGQLRYLAVIARGLLVAI